MAVNGRAPYVRGRRFEARAAEALRRLGYTVVRSAGSRGPVDLVALGAVRPLAVQCKTRGSLAPAERAALAVWAAAARAVPVVAARRGRRLAWAVLAPDGGDWRLVDWEPPLATGADDGGGPGAMPDG